MTFLKNPFSEISLDRFNLGALGNGKVRIKDGGGVFEDRSNISSESTGERGGGGL